MEVPRRLPDPTQDEIAASAALCAQIAREVSALGGFMPFERFMEMALFEPPYGYYVGGAHKFGAAGDFLTAPEISPLFGRAVAAQCVAAQVYGRTIVEFGGGSGRLAASVLEELARCGALPARYLIVELSPEVRARQRALLAQLPCASTVQIDWLSGPPAEPVDGIVLANEILGGGTQSRLLERLRQQEGISYGAGSQLRVSALEPVGQLTLWAIFAPENRIKVEQAIAQEVIQLLASGITEAELQDAKKSLDQQRLTSWAQDSTLAQLQLLNGRLGRNMAFYDKLYLQIAATSVQEVNAAIARWISPAQLFHVYAGDFAAAKNKAATGTRP